MQPFWHPLAKHEPSPNYWTDRLGHDMSQPSWVVLHTMVCCEPAAYARFRQPSQQASSTYGVKLDGSFVQYVDEKDGPWTDGTSEGVGSNLDVITIEHEDCGDYNGPRTPELYRTSALLVREICLRYGIPIDRQHIIRHRECSNASTACPDSLDVDRIVAMAAAGVPVPAPAPEYRRRNSPMTHTTIRPGSVPPVVDKLTVMGDGVAVHAVVTGGVIDPARDLLPGSWDSEFDETATSWSWSDDGQTLTFRGWERSAGHRVFETHWSYAAPVWSAPAVVAD